MARLPKCPVCECQVDKDTQAHVKHSSKTYHEHCFQQFELRKQHRNDLHNYICELYEIDFPNTFMLKQIKEFQLPPYKFTVKGIEYALRYFHEIEGNNPDAQGIGIVEYVYKKARDYYVNLSTVNQHNMNIEYDNTVETIYVAPPRDRKLKLIDLEEI
ncbi:hypothetical protein [Bacillus sp. FJAT-22090]|uniref:hypothetical protein n=1 Tax=Bacillus sp. FJAT-22090 TaxID=1581038 RepID=UPI0011A815A4|nr:hypothetical protein [Bacillus sp. FJAT-22090]